jgi:type 1 glutamine amidotransferase
MSFFCQILSAGRCLAVVILLSLAAHTCQSAEPAKKLLIIGDKPDGHPPTTHEFMAGAHVLEELLKRNKGLEVTVVDGKEPWEDGAELIRQADAVVIFVSEGGKWVQGNSRRHEALTQLAARGGGISALHWGIGAKDDKYVDGYQKLIGGIHGGSDRKYTKLKTKVNTAENHPITRGVGQFEIEDEFYYQLKFAKDGKLTPIVQATLDGALETVSWAWERPDGGRSFGFGMLHYHANWKDEAYRHIVTQGVLWTMKMDVPPEGVDVSVNDEMSKWINLPVPAKKKPK